MSEERQRFSISLPEPVHDALYADYPTFRAIMTILNRIPEVPDLNMRARLAQTTTHAFDHPILDFTIDEGRLFLLRISCPNRIFLRFTTRTDLRRFLEAARPEGVISGRQLASNPQGWPIYFEMMAAIDASKVDYQRVAEVLSSVLAQSPTRRVARQLGDTELQTLLREIHKPQEEYMFDQIIEDILDRINDNNFDEVLDSLGQYDPMAEEDPTSVPGMKLILMDDLVRERGCLLEQCRKKMLDVRIEFEAVGDRARSDIQELDALLAYIDTLQT